MNALFRDGQPMGVADLDKKKFLIIHEALFTRPGRNGLHSFRPRHEEIV